MTPVDCIESKYWTACVVQLQMHQEWALSGWTGTKHLWFDFIFSYSGVFFSDLTDLQFLGI